jgi:hypothetical protein
MASARARSETHSERRGLAATVAREIELLTARRQQVAGRQDRLRAQLRDLDAQLDELDARERELDRLAADDPYSNGASHDRARLLGGTALRRHAVAHLLAIRHYHEIHYRAWHDQLAATGILIRGTDPAATLLANITRSPIVSRATAPGTYRLDVDAEQRITTLLDRARKRLDALPERPSSASAQREALHAVIRRLESQRHEIADCRRLATTLAANGANRSHSPRHPHHLHGS